MAEFCLECFNRLGGTNYTRRDVVLDPDLCEECGEVKPCVVVLRRRVRFKLMIQDILDTLRQLRDRHTDKEN